MTVAEIKALASYPAEFRFVGNYRARWARVGNSVPPLLMKAIAERIGQGVLTRKSSTVFSATRALRSDMRVRY